MQNLLEKIRKIPKKIVITATIVILSIVLGVLISNKLFNGPHYKHYDLTNKEERRKNREAAEEQTYVKETVYKDADVPYYLFDWQFISKEDTKGLPKSSHMTNKELVKSLGEENIQKFTDNAQNYYKTLFNVNYMDIANNTSDYIDTLTGFFEEGTKFENPHKKNATYTCKEYASNVAEEYVDNKLNIKTKIRTDKSLVYFKRYLYYTRGTLEVIPESPSHKRGETCKPLKDLFGIECKYGEKTEIPFELKTIPSTSQLVYESVLYQEK